MVVDDLVLVWVFYLGCGFVKVILFGLVEVVECYGLLVYCVGVVYVEFVLLCGDLFDGLFGVLGVGEKIVVILLV